MLEKLGRGEEGVSVGLMAKFLKCKVDKKRELEELKKIVR